MNSDTVDYEDSCLIVRYLASMRPFAQSFDIYLTQVRLTLHDFFFEWGSKNLSIPGIIMGCLLYLFLGIKSAFCFDRSCVSLGKVPLPLGQKPWNVCLRLSPWTPAYWRGYVRICAHEDFEFAMPQLYNNFGLSLVLSSLLCMSF